MKAEMPVMGLDEALGEKLHIPPYLPVYLSTFPAYCPPKYLCRIGVKSSVVYSPMMAQKSRAVEKLSR